jgi:hypothetical protein
MQAALEFPVDEWVLDECSNRLSLNEEQSETDPDYVVWGEVNRQKMTVRVWNQSEAIDDLQMMAWFHEEIDGQIDGITGKKVWYRKNEALEALSQQIAIRFKEVPAW